jgi:hypothetical protein
MPIHHCLTEAFVSQTDLSGAEVLASSAVPPASGFPGVAGTAVSAAPLLPLRMRQHISYCTCLSYSTALLSTAYHYHYLALHPFAPEIIGHGA